MRDRSLTLVGWGRHVTVEHANVERPYRLSILFGRPLRNRSEALCVRLHVGSRQEALIDVTITSGPLFAVSVEPSFATLDIGQTEQFNFTALDDFGNQISDVLSTWSVPTEISEIDAAGVLTTGTEAGSFPGIVQVDVVKGTSRVSATADVTIRPDPIATVEVLPSSVLLLDADLSQDFHAAASDQYGNPRQS